MIYTIVPIDTIKNFLSYYGIDYVFLSSDIQSLVVILSNILFLLFWFFVAYFMYRILAWVLD